jgi:signal transduction histidine kinase
MIKIHQPLKVFKTSSLVILNYCLYFLIIGLFIFSSWNLIDSTKFIIFSFLILFIIIAGLVIDYFTNAIIVYDDYIIYKKGSNETKIAFCNIKSCTVSLLQGLLITTHDPKKFIKTPMPKNSIELLKIVKEKCCNVEKL